MENFLIWAHRGASADAPENTLAAFRLAEQQEAEGIELDVQLCHDGVPVILHDETLDRTSNGRGPVARVALADLARLDAGSWFGSEFAGEPLPTLATVLDWAGTRIRLNLEIKDAAAGSALLDLLRNYPRARVLVSSFNHRLLEQLRREDPDLPLGFLLDSRFWRRSLARAMASRATSLHPRADQVSRPLIRACHAAGLRVYVWTVDRLDLARKLQRMGVDGVFSNHPGRLRRELAGPS